MGGSAGGEVWGSVWSWHPPSLVRTTRMGLGCPAWGWQGCCHSRVAWFGGGSALSWAGKPCCCPGAAARSQGLAAGLRLAASTMRRGRLGSGRFPGKALLPHSRYLLSLQFWAVVSGQQQRPPHIQLLRSLGSHRLAGHAAGAGGSEGAGGRLPRQSHAAPLTPPEQQPGLASQQRFPAPLLLASSRVARQPWPLPHAVVTVKPQRGQPSSKPAGTLICGVLAWHGMAQHLRASLPISHPFVVPMGVPRSRGPTPHFSVWWGSAPLSCCRTPKGSPRLLVALSTKHFCSQPRIPSPDPALLGLFRSPPFPLIPPPPHPCNVKVELGCPGRAGRSPGVTTRLGGAGHAAPGVWEQSG